ncbi:PREDICTED: telomerase-binding protein EST1A isoform X1 [Rhagoletis zephyria]|uniref:telomerase-binding protein EST1A isoform X1 n=1 Tax=Rhagoletis zephyria TaxID=28612 RepID=UPI0008113961|nr:PREDICTED: telomerase-binding protein EST1A isoform X1 [Rhagoletis zephyria]
MNRKEAREQNDISIIRNLPKRLQRRIVEDVGDDSLVTVVDVDSQNAGGRPSPSSSGVARRNDNDMLPGSLLYKQETSGSVPQKSVEMGIGKEAATSIDFFLKKTTSALSSLDKNLVKKDTVPVLESSGKMTENNAAAMRCTMGGNLSNENSTIPGILRLNGEKAKGMIEKSVARENGKKMMARIRQLSDQPVNADKILTKSPSRQLQRKPMPPPWFEMLADTQCIESLHKSYEKVTSLLQQNTVIEKWTEFSEARRELQIIFAKLLLQQLKLCCEQKIDSFFWKLLYYNIREYFATNCKATPDIHPRLLSLIDEGLDFYTNLNMQLNSKYINPALQHAINIHQSKAPPHCTTHKFEFIAKVAAQKLLICLGDLCRYKAKELQSNDYTGAAKYYQQAQALIPSNGIPYNQMAIVAIQARKKFDAIYFHMRSLMASNAIYSARESLLVLFDEIRKKYEENELKASPVHQCSPRHSKNTSKSMRKEVWIHVDGVRRLHRSSESDDTRSKYAVINEERRLNELTGEELLRRFTSLYLYVIGKLYTGIGMETIVEHQRKLLAQLSVLLKHNSFPIKRSRLLRIVALNIFQLEHNMHKETRREIRYYAFNFCTQIFGLLLRKCNEIIESSNFNVLYPEQTCFADINTLLQYINIYTGWLARNVDIWECVRNEDHVIIETWTEWECFYPYLRRLLDAAPVNITQHIQLEEEISLLGFTPLVTTSGAININKQIDKESATECEQFFARITKILDFQECYERNQSRLLVRENSFTLEELNGAMKHALCTLHSDEEDNSENISVNGTNTEEPFKDTKSAKTACIQDAQISLLSKRRKELEARKNVKKMYSAKLEEILKFVDTKLYIEVRPRYLMPDTNCFIDCLDDFKKLFRDYKRYILVIPLTVVKELDGLSKGVKVESNQNSLQMHRIHHYDDVSTCAKRSLDFIRSAKNNIKCATTKGSFINASLFALAEEENVSNDDKILATAVALSKSMSTETNKDGKCFIQTELVLVTTDRNLRVKALARNLTVSEMGEFLQWAKDCNT